MKAICNLPALSPVNISSVDRSCSLTFVRGMEAWNIRNVCGRIRTVGDIA